jgi:NAD(P)-dependent dehydrogenase (short-subunit alcohol dehydrogenase family)
MSPTAFVTGASRGIGKIIAVALANAGYDVAIAARTARSSDPTADHSLTVRKTDTRPLPGSLEETAALVTAAGQRALTIRLDLTDPASVEEGVSELLDAWGGVDVLVNNGRHIGPGLVDSILDTPLDAYDKFLRAHAIAPIAIVSRLLPPMLERGGGTIVTISSKHAYDQYPADASTGLAYRLAKAAGHTLAGSLLAEYGTRGIRAFNLSPGFVLTERNAMDADELGFAPGAVAPAELVGAALVWLVSDPAADTLQRGNVEAQELVIEKGLYPDWRTKAVSSAGE